MRGGGRGGEIIKDLAKNRPLDVATGEWGGCARWEGGCRRALLHVRAAAPCAPWCRAAAGSALQPHPPCPRRQQGLQGPGAERGRPPQPRGAAVAAPHDGEVLRGVPPRDDLLQHQQGARGAARRAAGHGGGAAGAHYGRGLFFPLGACRASPPCARRRWRRRRRAAGLTAPPLPTLHTPAGDGPRAQPLPLRARRGALPGGGAGAALRGRKEGEPAGVCGQCQMCRAGWGVGEGAAQLAIRGGCRSSSARSPRRRTCRRAARGVRGAGMGGLAVRGVQEFAGA